ncbi:MAG: hypothetical protein ABJB05_16880 [Parafilimonas sp.]
MEFSGFQSAPREWSTDKTWHVFGPVDFDIDQLLAFANEQNDNCTVAKIKWDITDKRFFKVYIKPSQVPYTFYMIFSTTVGELYSQKIQYNGKTILSIPVEISQQLQ